MTHEAQIQRLQRALIEMQLREAAKELGIAPTAIDDVVLHSGSFRVSVSDDATTILSERGESPRDWLRGQRSNRPHWFGAATDGRQEAASKDGGEEAENPWQAQFWNRTKQAQIITADEKRAEQMARAAGVDVYAMRPKK